VFVTWSKNLEIGVDFVDADHKVLIKLLNQVNDCIVQHEESTVIGSVLEALVEYTDYHFLREEKMMKISGYPNLLEHREIHLTLSSKVRKIYNDYQSEPWKVNPDDILAFLKSWLVEHIMGHDIEYREMCIDNKQATRAANNVSFLNVSDANGFPDWSNIRIMLVDDNPNFRRLVQTILKAVGVRHLQLINSADKAVARLSQRSADIVLCDMMMDGMSGTEFARQLEKMELPTRLVMMTGFSVDTMKDRSSDINVAGFLEKPIKARELLETIASAANQGHSVNDS